MMIRYRLTPTLDLESISSTATAVLGYTPEEYEADPGLLFRRLHPDDRSLWRDQVQGSEPLAEPLTLRWVHRAGHTVWIEQQAVSIQDRTGSRVAIECTGWDVSEYKRSERRLCAEHAVLRLLTTASSLEDAAPTLVDQLRDSLDAQVGELWMLDREESVLRCTLVSPQEETPDLAKFAEESRQLTIAQGVGLPGRVWADRRPLWTDDLVHDPTFLRATTAADTALRSAIAFPIVSDGEFFGVLAFHAAYSLEPDPQLMEAMGIIGAEIGQFIQRRRVEQALHQSEERFRLVLQASNDVIWDYDFTGDRLWWSENFERIFGGTAADLRAYVMRIHPDDREQVRAQFSAATVGGKRFWTSEHRFLRIDGSHAHVLVRAQFIHDEATGEPLRAIGSMTDISQYKRIERARSQSEERFRLAVANYPHPFVIYDAQRRIRFANQQTLAISGLTEEEVLGRTDEAIFPLEATKAYLPLLERAIETRAPQVGECTFTTSTGTYSIIVTYVPVLADRGEIKQILGITQDISERKAAEERLYHSEERFSRIFWTSPVAIGIVSLADARLIDVNERFLQLFGYERDKLIGHPVPERTLWADADEQARILDMLSSGQAVHNQEIEARSQSGQIREVLASFELIELNGEQCILALGQDVTERRQREREREALIRVASKLRAAVTRAEITCVLLDQTEELLAAQGVALALRDRENGDIVIERSQGRWPDMTGVRLTLDEGITGQVITSGQLFTTKDLSSLPQFLRPELLDDVYAAVCVPFITEQRVLGALWVIRSQAFSPAELGLLSAIADMAANAMHRAQIVETLEQRVAERTQALAQANQRLQELDRLKTKFVSDVSHELRTPITNLKLYLDLLEQGDPTRRPRYLAALKEQTNWLAQLIEDILNLARLEIDGHSTHFVPVDLNTLVKSIVAAHHPLAQSAGLILHFDPSPGLPPILGRPNQLAQVVTNLVANAISYTPSGQVTVATFAKGQRVCLQVQDTGLGIHPEDRPYLFERFYRGRRVSQLNIRGTGLGLGIVKEIVDRHQGEIEVESELDVGSTFRIWLPLGERI